MPPRKRPGRWVFWLALALVIGLPLLYLLAANALLSGNRLRKTLDKGPNRTYVDWESARSFWPGRAEVTRLRIRDRDLGAEWMFELSHARVSYSLLDLLRRRFHVTSAHGRGLTFRARNRLKKEDATPERVRDLPPIFGFPDPPLLQPGEARPPRTGKEFTIHVENLAVEGVREIWVDAERFRFDGRLTGGFHIEPKIHAEIFPTVLQVRSGRLDLRRVLVAQDVAGTLRGFARPWNPRRFPGSQMLRFMDGGAALATRVGMAPLDRLLGGFGQLHMERGDATLQIQARMEKGLTTGTATVSSRDLGARVVDFRLRGRLSGLLRFRNLDLRKYAATLSGSHVEMRGIVLEGQTDPKSEPWWFRVDLESGTARLSPPAALEGRVKANARDARPLLATMKVNIPRWLAGLFDLEGVRAVARLRLAPAQLEVTGLDARVGDYHVQGDYRSRGKSKRAVFLIDLGALSFGIAIRDGVQEIDVLAARKWFRDQTGREPRSSD